MLKFLDQIYSNAKYEKHIARNKWVKWLDFICHRKVGHFPDNESPLRPNEDGVAHMAHAKQITKYKVRLIFM